MAVIIGSARIDEKGNARGGKAGDQKGSEVSRQNWYRHSKTWRVLRANEPEHREMIALCMERACDNRHIGYDQGQRNTLYNVVKSLGFDTGRVTTDCETDCSALVRVCCAYAGIMLENFTTPYQANVMLKSGMFTELKGSEYTNSSDYLLRGDILVTKTQGHTVVVLSNGAKSASRAPIRVWALGERVLSNGSDGADVKELQNLLIQLGFSCGSYGADGDFGDATEMAVRKFQRSVGIEVDGEVGAVTLGELKSKLGSDTASGKQVIIRGGDCYIRTAPNTQKGAILGVAREGGLFRYQDVTSEDGWLLIIYNNENAWVSGKYGRLI